MFRSGYYVTVELRLTDGARIDIARQGLKALVRQTPDESGG